MVPVETCTMSDFDRVSEWLKNWPEVTGLDKRLENSCCDRLRRALAAMLEGDREVGKGDLTGLLRQYLRLYQINKRVPIHREKIPKEAPWPNEVDYRAVGFGVTDLGDRYRIKVSSWEPEWLDGLEEGMDPLEAVFKGEYRLPPDSDDSLKMDLALRNFLEFENYKSDGQKTALRAAFIMPPGSTLVVNLPTGSGKSLVAYAPVLFAARKRRKVSVFIVPTVALALDQEKQVRGLLRQMGEKRWADQGFAWHGSLGEEERKKILERIDSGDQGVIITSPESLGGFSLSKSLNEAAERGGLGYFVIDEAHMFEQWGGDFRPEFQSLAGLRNGLLRKAQEKDPEARFRTLLMTATLTQSCYELLSDFFGNRGGKPEIGEFGLVSAVHLRPEPSYWVQACRDPSERKERVEELIRHLPRPFIIYSSKRDDVDEWFRVLREMGIKRCAKFHGGTGEGERKEVIDKWSRRELDVISANTAFGLGIDQSEVRAVVHACVPETLDRYYQEVGRGGRDGKACISFLLWEPTDLEIGKKLAEEKYIGDDKGWGRWEKLNSMGKDKKGGRWEVDLTEVPSWLNGPSKSNESWNLRTLLLMNRAGIIEVDCSEPHFIPREEEESDEVFMRKRDKAGKWVSIFKGDHGGWSEQSGWEQAVGPKRDAILKRNAKNWGLVEEDLLGRAPKICDLLEAIYQIDVEGEKIEVTRACGGCPGCRRSGDIDPLTRYAESVVLNINEFSFKGYLKGCFDKSDILCVSYTVPSQGIEEEQWKDRVTDVIKLCISQGIRKVAVSKKHSEVFNKQGSDTFIIDTDIESEIESKEEGPLEKIPQISVLDPEYNTLPFPSELLRCRPGVILFPDQIKSHRKENMRFSDTVNVVNMRNFLEELRS